MTTKKSLTALIERARATLSSKAGCYNPAIDAIACAIAGVSFGNYGYQDQLFRELHPETCSESWLYLHASRHETPRLLPTFSRGSVQFQQLSGVVTVPKNTRLVFGELEFETIDEQHSNKPIAVIALKMGAQSNMLAGTVLKLVQALSGVNPNNITCLGFGGGADIEDLEHWRQRVIVAFRKDQIIGRSEDYAIWANAAHVDVDYAWALDNTPALGMIEVYVGAKTHNPTLSPAVVDVVQAEFDKKRLAGCHPVAKLPEHVPLHLTIQGVDDLSIRENIIAEVQTFFISKMGEYDKTTNTLDPISPTEIILTINKITSQFILKSPSDEQFITTHQIFVLGDISWI